MEDGGLQSCAEDASHASRRMCFVAMILRNAYVAMNGNITSSFYELQPPSFESWIGQPEVVVDDDAL